MKQHPSVDIHEKVHALLAILDKDIATLSHHLTTLETLREGVIKRDETGLKAMLEVVRQRQHQTHAQESQRQALRNQLASALGYESADLTLSVLSTHLSGSLQTEIAEKRRLLRDLTAQVQRQWQLTRALLQDCIRLNRQLFRAIFTQTAPAATYGPSGGMQRMTMEASMVNIHY